MTIDAAWKQRIVSGHALDAVKVSNSGRIVPPFTLPQSGRPCTLRALRTTLTNQLERDPSAVDAEQVRAQFLADVCRGGGHAMLSFTGQSAELIHDIPAASDLVACLVTDAEHAPGSAPHISRREAGRRPVKPKELQTINSLAPEHTPAHGVGPYRGVGMNLTATRGPR